jgi:hypothetical protein
MVRKRERTRLRRMRILESNRMRVVFMEESLTQLSRGTKEMRMGRKRKEWLRMMTRLMRTRGKKCLVRRRRVLLIGDELGMKRKSLRNRKKMI